MGGTSESRWEAVLQVTSDEGPDGTVELTLGANWRLKNFPGWVLEISELGALSVPLLGRNLR